MTLSLPLASSLDSAAEVRTAVKALLSEAAEVASDGIAYELNRIVTRTSYGVHVDAAEATVTGIGDAFPAELVELVRCAEEGDFDGDRLAFLVALAVYAR